MTIAKEDAKDKAYDDVELATDITALLAPSEKDEEQKKAEKAARIAWNRTLNQRIGNVLKVVIGVILVGVVLNLAFIPVMIPGAPKVPTLVCSEACPKFRSPNCTRPVVGAQCSTPVDNQCCQRDGPVCIQYADWRECALVEMASKDAEVRRERWQAALAFVGTVAGACAIFGAYRCADRVYVTLSVPE